MSDLPAPADEDAAEIAARRQRLLALLEAPLWSETLGVAHPRASVCRHW